RRGLPPVGVRQQSTDHAGSGFEHVPLPTLDRSRFWTDAIAGEFPYLSLSRSRRVTEPVVGKDVRSPEREGNRRDLIPNTELRKDPRLVLLHRFRADSQLSRDLFRRQSRGRQGKDLAFARRQVPPPPRFA